MNIISLICRLRDFSKLELWTCAGQGLFWAIWA